MPSGGDINYIINVNGSNAVDNINNINNAFGNLRAAGDKLKSIGVAFSLAVSTPLMLAVKTGLNFNSAMQQAQSNFTVMLGSAEKATAMVSQLKKFADTTPFEMKDLLDSSKTLLAFGLTADSIMPSVKMLGDVAMGNKEKFKSLSLAYAQIQSTGRLMGQDLLQLVNAGFNPLQTISEKTGLSMKDLKEKMEKGGISADAVTKAFQIATSSGGRFFNAMNESSTTFEGQMSTLKDSVNNALGVVTKPLFEVIAQKVTPALVKAITGLTKVFESLSETQKRYVVVVGAIVISIGPLLLAIAGVIKLVGIMIGVFKTLSTVMTIANLKIIAISVGVLALAALATLVIRSWTPVSTFFVSLWEAIKTTFALGGGYLVGTFQVIKLKVAEFMNYSIGGMLKGMDNLLSSMSKLPLIGESMASAADGARIAADSFKAFEDDANSSLIETSDSVDALKAQLAGNLKDIGDTAKNAGGAMVTDVQGMVAAANGKIQELFNVPQLTGGVAGDIKDLSINFDELAGDAGAAAKKMVDSMKDVTKEIVDQSKSFSGFVGLFDKVSRSGTGSGASLTNRLRKQVEEMKQWSQALTTIQEKLGGGNDDFMNELRKMGAGSAKQIIGLSRLDEGQLKEYSNLFGQKQAYAWQEAKQVVKFEHSGTIVVRGVDLQGETQEIASIVAQDLAANSSRYSKQPAANKAFK